MAKYKPKDGAIKFKAATKNMTSKEKIKYTWEYYKWWIISSITVIALIYHTITTINPSTYLHITITSGFVHTIQQFPSDLDDVNETPEFEQPPDLYGFFVDTTELSLALEHLLLDETYDSHTILVQNLFIDFETIQVFTTLAGAGELDLVIAYLHDFDTLAAFGHLKNMRNIDVDLPDHIFIDDHGILLNYIPIFHDYLYPQNKDISLVLGIMAESNRIENVKHFLNTLID